jgi:two-component system probable response regulator PhcQ
MTTLIFVDDEVNILSSLKRLIRHSGCSWDVHTFTSTTEAFEALHTIPLVNIIVSDYRMPIVDGVTFLNQTKKIQPHALRILLSGQTDMLALLQAVNEAEIFRFITKPWNDDDLLMTLKNAVQHQMLQEENMRLANTVRKQQKQINEQTQALVRLEKESPGITRLQLDEDGSIDLSEEFNED